MELSLYCHTISMKVHLLWNGVCIPSSRKQRGNFWIAMPSWSSTFLSCRTFHFNESRIWICIFIATRRRATTLARFLWKQRKGSFLKAVHCVWRRINSNKKWRSPFSETEPFSITISIQRNARLERRAAKGRVATWGRRGQIERRESALTSFLGCRAMADRRKPRQYQSLLPAPAWQRWAGSGSSPLLLSATCSWRSWGSRGGNLETRWCHSGLGRRRHKTQLEERKKTRKKRKTYKQEVSTRQERDTRNLRVITFLFNVGSCLSFRPGVHQIFKDKDFVIFSP